MNNDLISRMVLLIKFGGKRKQSLIIITNQHRCRQRPIPTAVIAALYYCTGKEFHSKLHYQQGIQYIVQYIVLYNAWLSTTLTCQNDYALHCTTGKEFHVAVLLSTNNDPYPSPTTALLERSSIKLYYSDQQRPLPISNNDTTGNEFHQKHHHEQGVQHNICASASL